MTAIDRGGFSVRVQGPLNVEGREKGCGSDEELMIEVISWANLLEDSVEN